jgi:hypothetical protein
MPPAGQYDPTRDFTFVNAFFEPAAIAPKKAAVLAALDPAAAPTLEERVTQLGLLDGRPEGVAATLTTWLGKWDAQDVTNVLNWLTQAVTSGVPVLFTWTRSGGGPAESPVQVARPDWPDDRIVINITSVHP